MLKIRETSPSFVPLFEDVRFDQFTMSRQVQVSEIVEPTSKLMSIELLESYFRIKHDLQTISIFHVKEESINFHILFCFIALFVSTVSKNKDNIKTNKIRNT